MRWDKDYKEGNLENVRNEGERPVKRACGEEGGSLKRRGKLNTFSY